MWIPGSTGPGLIDVWSQELDVHPNHAESLIKSWLVTMFTIFSLNV